MTTVGRMGLGNDYSQSIMPQEKSTRQIVREEIKRQKQLDQLEQRYEAGEISDFEYKASKALIHLEGVLSNNGQNNPPYVCNCVG